MSCSGRWLTALASLVLIWSAAPAARAAGTIREPLRDAVSYDAELTSSVDGRSFSGTETIIVRNAGRRPLDRVWLRLWGNGPVGCAPRAVTVTSVAGATKRRLLRDCSALELVLPAALPRGAQTTLTLGLSIALPTLRDRFGTAEGIHLYGNALPVVAQRDAGGWRLPPYSAYGESFVSSWARFSLVLHHPVTLPVAAAGTTTTVPDPHGQTATTRSTIEARDTFWGIGPMQEVTGRTARGTLVRAWSEPGAGGDREDVLEQAIGALEQLERRLPAYPYDEFDLVVARIEAGGGMEYPSVVLTDGSDEVTRHETGHQWFYGLVGDDQFREPWVDEGLTSFLEYSWTAGERAAPRCYRSSRIDVPEPVSFATGSMTYWNAHVRQYTVAYDNPVCALRDQRTLLGTPRFERVMRSLVTRHARGFLTGAEIRLAFRAAGGRRSDAIWRRWALAPGR